MKIKELFEVVRSEKKSGTSSKGQAWEKTEYLLKNILEREDGSVVETMITADTSQSVGELKVGAKYNATVFITSRPFEKDGKTLHFVSFRVTYAELVEDAPSKNTEPATDTSAINDDIPF